MDRFLKWLDRDAPGWALLMAIASSSIAAVIAIMITFAALAHGHWVFGVLAVLVWVVIPACLVFRAYINSINGDSK